jgi:hypothetical protein
MLHFPIIGGGISAIDCRFRNQSAEQSSLGTRGEMMMNNDNSISLYGIIHQQSAGQQPAAVLCCVSILLLLLLASSLSLSWSSTAQLDSALVVIFTK